MEPRQEEHLSRIAREFLRLVEVEYRRGQQEHGGNLFDATPASLVENALDEAIDQVVYLITLRDKIRGEFTG